MTEQMQKPKTLPKAINLYSNGLPFNGELERNIINLQERVRNKKASLIIISGGLGEGKTTLAIHIGDYINKMYGLPPIELTKESLQISMGGKDFIKKVNMCYEQNKPCLIYDEAGDFSKRGALTQFNNQLNRIFEVFRGFKIIMILVLPNFNNLDQQIFDNKIPRCGLICKERTKSGNYYGYSLYRMELIRARLKKYSMKNFAYSSVHSNFYGHFKNLPPIRSKQLDRLSTQSKYGILIKTEILADGLMGFKDLADKLKRTDNWVRIKTRELKIKPVRVIKRKKYFSETAYNKLLGCIKE